MITNLTSITYDNTHFSKPITEDSWGRTNSENKQKEVQSIAPDVALPGTVRQYVSAAVADSTRRAYQSDLTNFVRWGGQIPSSMDLLVAYIADQAETLSPVTITRRIVAISRAHTSQGYPDPTKTDLVRTVLRGVRRKNGKPQRQVTPVLKQDLLAMLPLMTGAKGTRDRALLLLGFSAALRRSELVALDVADLAFVNEGLVLHLRKSKTDQEGQGRKIGVPYGRTAACPVKAVQEWLLHSKIVAGPIATCINKAGRIGGRLSAHSVALIVKKYAKAIGLKAEDISGHSLRSGLVTSAAQAGIPAHRIMAQTGHRSMEMLNRYIRDGNLFVENAGGIL